MVKKRQREPAVKIGRTLRKGRNVTSVKFKAKPIVVKQKELKGKTAMTVDDYLKKVNAANPSVKKSGLSYLKMVLENKPQNLMPHVSEALTSVLKCMEDTDNILKTNVADVFVKILSITTDIQIINFIPYIFNLLDVLIKHTMPEIKNTSLIIMQCLIKKHPDLVCHSMTLLQFLLNLLKLPLDHEILPPLKLHSTPVSHNLQMSGTSEYKYPISVLYLMNIFFKEMLKNKMIDKDYDRDEQEVYWNCKNPTNIAVYARSGLHPVDIEKPYCYDLEQDIYFGKTGEPEKFIDQILNVLHGIYAKEISGETKSEEKLLSRDAIGYLNIIFQVYCHVIEWADLISHPLDPKINEFVIEKIHSRGDFKFEMHGRRGDSGQIADCTELNLSVCYLSSIFLMQHQQVDENIFEYVKRVLTRREGMSPFEVKYASIPIFIKIIKFYLKWMNMPGVKSFLSEALSLLCSFFKSLKFHQPNAKMLASLFIKLSLDPKYKCIAETDCLKHWFNWLLEEAQEKNKQVLKVIKKIANRRYPSFQASPDIIRNLLKEDDEDVRDTAGFLISCMTEIPQDIIEDVTHLILVNPSFSKRLAFRFIRLIKDRFTKEPEQGKVTKSSIYHEEGFVTFAVFLLNIAVDSYNLNDENMVDIDANEYTRAIKPVQNIHPFTVYPSLYWKEHSELFEECHQYLKQLPRQHVNKLIKQVSKETLNNSVVLPMHCAIAVLKLNDFETQDKYYQQLIFELTYSCLLTTSALTDIPTDDEWYKWNVYPLMDCMKFNRMATLHIVSIVIENLGNTCEGIAAYHVLRTFQVFLTRNLLLPEDAERVLNTLESLKDKCTDKTFKQQPLFIELYKYFHYYL